MICVTLKQQTIEAMRILGVYKPQFDPMIETYCGLKEQYKKLQKEVKKRGFQMVVPTGMGGLKKNPIIGIMESLRKDILIYSDRLCLNPKALDAVKIVQPAAASKEDEALSKAEELMNGNGGQI